MLYQSSYHSASYQSKSQDNVVASFPLFIARFSQSNSNHIKQGYHSRTSFMLGRLQGNLRLGFSTQEAKWLLVLSLSPSSKWPIPPRILENQGNATPELWWSNREVECVESRCQFPVRCDESRFWKNHSLY